MPISIKPLYINDFFTGLPMVYYEVTWNNYIAYFVKEDMKDIRFILFRLLLGVSIENT